MSDKSYILKGNLIHTPEWGKIEYHIDEYLVCENGKSAGIFGAIPDEYRNLPVYDYTDKIIIPGMYDMHVHAPQYGFRGIGMSFTADEWQNWFVNYSLPEESRYADIKYADKAYQRFVNDMLKTTTTARACIYATIHRGATELLMDKLDRAGLGAYVGKLNMDRNSLDGYIETTDETIGETEKWVLETKDKYSIVKPMITPRYIPTCTDECMRGISRIAHKYNIPVQSHLSENLEEIEWVKSLKPEIEFYGQAYDMYGMLGDSLPSVMAHVCCPEDAEYELLKQRKNVIVAHCPTSNMNTRGGVCRVMDMMDDGIKVGLGTDVAASPDLSLMHAMTDAMKASKLHWVYTERGNDYTVKRRFLGIAEAMYLATMGGGQLFGKCGCFEKGYEFDAVVLDDSDLKDFIDRPLEDRFQRVVWQHSKNTVMAKFVRGEKIYER